jgi:hypothetical protein
VAKEHLETSLKLLQEELQKVVKQYDEEVNSWKQERNELHKKIGETFMNQEDVLRNFSTIKQKC